MDWVWIALGIALLVVCLIYALYQNGYAILSFKAALTYMGYPRWGKRKDCIRASFVACSGFTKRIVRLLPSEHYQFVFSSRITKGTVSVEIYTGRKEFVAHLNEEHPTTIVPTDSQTRFRVITRFKKADGDYSLVWSKAK
ncbi:MAG: hypothetical protein ACLRPX_00555 [Ruthenibacterium sp.]